MMHRILVIEDDHNILLMIKKMLEKEGFEIKLASNGNEGLNLFKKISVDLVITDIIMPEKEGLETIREMKRLRPDVKIVAMSGGGKISADTYLDTAKIFGASNILTKPFTRKQLISAVQDNLGKSSTDSLIIMKKIDNSGLKKEQR